MPLDLQIKLVAFKIAMDVTLKGMNRSPERCTRNLLELIESSYPEKIDFYDKDALYATILGYCKNSDSKTAKETILNIITT